MEGLAYEKLLSAKYLEDAVRAINPKEISN